MVVMVVDGAIITGVHMPGEEDMDHMVMVTGDVVGICISNVV